MKSHKRIHDDNMSIYYLPTFQYKGGSYLPNESQPNPNENWEITAMQFLPHSSTRYINVCIGSNGIAQRKNAKGEFCEADRDLPELYLSRDECCGCTACYAICPMKAIVMRPCEEGFLYPVVDAEKCVRCYRCVSVCPIKASYCEE